MVRSIGLLKTHPIDLMQIHNLLDWKIHLPILREWKVQGRIRYIVIIHYNVGGHADLKQSFASSRLILFNATMH